MWPKKKKFEVKPVEVHGIIDIAMKRIEEFTRQYIDEEDTKMRLEVHDGDSTYIEAGTDFRVRIRAGSITIDVTLSDNTGYGNDTVSIYKSNICSRQWKQYVSDIKHLHDQVKTAMNNKRQLSTYNKIVIKLDDPIDKMLGEKK